MDNTKIGIKRGNSNWKKGRNLQMKGTNKYTETYLICHNIHRGLFQLKEYKFMCTHSKDGAMWDSSKSIRERNKKGGGEGMEGKLNGNYLKLFCPIDTALVLASDNFHSIFSPSPPLLPSSCFFPSWLLLETITWCHLYCVFTYNYSLLIEGDLCECWNISVKFLCVYLCLSSGDLFTFW